MTGRRLWRARCSSTPRPKVFCVWGGYGPLILNLDGTERTYQPLGDRGMLSMMSGSLGTADQGAELNLNATDPDALALIDVAPVRARATILAELVFDASGTDLLAVNVVLRGRMDRVLRDDTAATAQGGRAGSVLKAIVRARRGPCGAGGCACAPTRTNGCWWARTGPSRRWDTPPRSP